MTTAQQSNLEACIQFCIDCLRDCENCTDACLNGNIVQMMADFMKADY